MQHEKPHLMFQERSLVRPDSHSLLDTSAQIRNNNEHCSVVDEVCPPLHRFENYWSCVLEYGRCNKRQFDRAVSFEPKSIFQQSFEDVINKNSRELTGFLLYVASQCSSAVFKHYAREIRSYLFFSESDDKSSITESTSQLTRSCSENSINIKSTECREHFSVIVHNRESSNTSQSSKNLFERNTSSEHLPYNLALMNEVKTRFYQGYLESPYHYRFQREILRNCHYTLGDFLYCEHALRHLREFMELEQMQKVLLFWIAVDNFRRCVNNRTFDHPGDVRSDALSIYQKFIALGSPYYLGLDEAIRSSIEYCISPETRDAVIDSQCYDLASWIAYRAMEQVFKQRFRSSVIYQAFLSELTLRSHHTTPAADTAVLNTSKRQLLSIGRLDSLGRFIRASLGSTADHVEYSSAPTLQQKAYESSIAGKFARDFINDVVYRSTSCVSTIDDKYLSANL